MANQYFRFKQFTVFHDQCAMKVGADGVTLGAWPSIDNTKKILDVGCGSGLIALMLAQRSTADIYAIDIDHKSTDQAKNNFLSSPWSERISVNCCSLQNYSPEKPKAFDLIVSNPPYFVNSLKAPSINRTIARHTDTLSHQDLITHSIRLLSTHGRLCVILPVLEGAQYISMAKDAGLFCNKRTDVFPNYQSKAKRLLLEFSRKQSATICDNLVIESERGIYTPAYAALTKDFYLNL